MICFLNSLLVRLFGFRLVFKNGFNSIFNSTTIFTSIKKTRVNRSLRRNFWEMFVICLLSIHAPVLFSKKISVSFCLISFPRRYLHNPCKIENSRRHAFSGAFFKPFLLTLKICRFYEERNR